MCLAPPTLLRQQPQYVPTTACAPRPSAAIRCRARRRRDGLPCKLADRRYWTPTLIGGLGLRSATDNGTRPTGHHEVAARLLHELDAARCPALQAVGHAVAHLRAAGYNPPSWRETLAEGPPTHNNPEHGDQLRGWQRHATQAAEERAAEVLLTTLPQASQALLHSQAGCYGGRAFAALPTSPELELPSQKFRVALLRRLRLPLPIAPRRCACGRDLDAQGDHRAACANSGALAARAPALEQAVARICREAGATVARNVALADMNIADAVLDGRRIEIVANGLHAYHGQQLAIDTTCVSPLTRTGQPHPGTTTEPGRALAQAVARKRRRYPELLAARSRCKLLVFAIEVGGRWGPEAQRLLRQLAHQRAQEAPAWLCRAASAGWQLRWSAIAAVAAQRALATSLLELPTHGDTLGGHAPDLPDLLADTRYEVPAAPSRLPAS